MGGYSPTIQVSLPQTVIGSATTHPTMSAIIESAVCLTGSMASPQAITRNFASGYHLAESSRPEQLIDQSRRSGLMSALWQYECGLSGRIGLWLAEDAGLEGIQCLARDHTPWRTFRKHRMYESATALVRLIGVDRETGQIPLDIRISESANDVQREALHAWYDQPSFEEVRIDAASVRATTAFQSALRAMKADKDYAILESTSASADHDASDPHLDRSFGHLLDGGILLERDYSGWYMSVPDKGIAWIQSQTFRPGQYTFRYGDYLMCCGKTLYALQGSKDVEVVGEAGA